MSDYIIETIDLCKKYKTTYAVKDLNLKVKKGEIYGFLGPNGSGKTTSIKMLLGLIKASSGSVTLFGKKLESDRNHILKKVGALVESPSYYGHLTGYENLKIIQRMLNVPEGRIEEVLNIVRLTNAKNQLVKQYSLGMKQRLGIAIALLGEPELLILDEPTNGLDPAGIHEIRDLIKSLPETEGITILISSHLLSEIDQMATQVGIISDGNLIYQDSIEVLRNMDNPHIKIRVNDSNKAKSILEEKTNLHIEVDKNGDLLISKTDDDHISVINSILVNSNISVYRIEEVRSSLEEIFLNIIKGENT
ncbi:MULTISPECIES: ABC transporter ATP-binding protein [unclassified Lysinibacillus]|uniref:ABC transporter ATP-binding protein n=1 Tax=unclassified Lysinibacillus TaxID=2636778 RepID=UPI00255643F6|nr:MULTISPECIES: ABC transporter ATP-binding protein [unclassified Lysinibacillus]MDM5250919.1 ABC transporter ATP-binding protein [Lysinibacillus sp. G4S2]